MTKGSYFGEIEIIFKQKRSNTVITAEHCEILFITKQIYENLLVKEYPEVSEEMKYIAKVRLEKNLEAIKNLNKNVSAEKHSRRKKKRVKQYFFLT